MRRRRSLRRGRPGYPSAGDVLENRREFLGMVGTIMTGAVVLGPAVALAGAPDEPVSKPGQMPVPDPPEPFPELDGDVVVPDPPRTRGVVRPPDPPKTGGVPPPPDPPPDPPPGDPPSVGCDPDTPVPRGGIMPEPQPYIMDGVMVPPEEPGD